MPIKRNATKYSGLPLLSLIHLVSTKAPVNELLKREVWKELFTRYYNEGRTFNLYTHLKGNPEMFANTIGWELSREQVVIPVAHAEAFILNLLDFIQYIDQKVLENGVEFEWQLHELDGLKGMLEKVRDAKIQDSNTRQKINLFIDKINDSRKKSLVLIEQAKMKQAEGDLVKGNNNELVIIQGNNELVVTEQNHELMKQELKHLSIPVSKLTKGKWEEAIEQFDTYYPKDQQALIRYGLKRGFSFYSHQRHMLEAFKLNLEWKIPTNMTFLLFRGVSYSNQIKRLFGTEEAFFHVVEDWYLSALGSTEKGWKMFSTRLLETMAECCTDVYEASLFANTTLINRTMEQLMDFYPMVKQYTGAKFSEIIQTSVPTMEQVNHTPSIELDKNANQWIVNEGVFAELEVSVFEKFYMLFDYVRGHRIGSGVQGLRLVEYLIEVTPVTTVTIDKRVPTEFHAMLRDYCHFLSTLVIDEEISCLLDNPLFQWKPNHFHHDKNFIEKWFKAKFNSGAVSNQELTFLFKAKEGLRLFKEVVSNSGFGDGWLKSRGDYIGRFFDRILALFDFKNVEEREWFFKLPIEANSFFDKRGYLTPEQAQMVVDKLQLESPHEYQLISEYFSNIDMTYEEFVVHPMFDYLSDLERLLLGKEGVKVGETKIHRGYKENGVEYTSKEAENKFVIEYFQTLYQGEGKV